MCVPWKNRQTKKNAIEGEKAATREDMVTKQYPTRAPFLRPIISYRFLETCCQYIIVSQVSRDGRFELLIYCYIIVIHSERASPGFGALFALHAVFYRFRCHVLLTGRVLVRGTLILTFSHSQTIADGNFNSVIKKRCFHWFIPYTTILSKSTCMHACI